MDILAEHLTTDNIGDQQQTLPPKIVALATGALRAVVFPILFSAISPTDEEGPASNYTPKANLNVKVLDFVQLGGPTWTVDRTVFRTVAGISVTVPIGSLRPMPASTTDTALRKCRASSAHLASSSSGTSCSSDICSGEDLLGTFGTQEDPKA